jgi:hypothetical protein
MEGGFRLNGFEDEKFPDIIVTQVIRSCAKAPRLPLYKHCVSSAHYVVCYYCCRPERTVRYVVIRMVCALDIKRLFRS